MTTRDKAGGGLSATRDERALHDALLRFLLRERSAARADLGETYALPVPARVEAGHAIAGLRPLGWIPGTARLRLLAPFNHSGFRPAESLRIGPGLDPAAEPEVRLVDYDPQTGEVTVEVPRYGGDRAAVQDMVARHPELVLDRGDVDMSDTRRRALEQVFDNDGRDARAIRDLLMRRTRPVLDEAAAAVARTSLERLVQRGYALADAQREAFVESWAAAPFQLVQGPPGTGKTFVLALLLAALAWRGEKVLVTAQSHLAIDNVMAQLARIVQRERRSIPMVRVTNRPDDHQLLAGLPVELAARAKRVVFPASGGAIVGATLYAALPFSERPPFDRVVFDEAAQVPVPDAVCALLAGPRWLFVGDDRQLGPVITGEHAPDDICGSIFAYLRAVAEPRLLDETFRLNDALCAFPSRAFYDGRLRPSRAAAARRFALPAPSAFDDVLDPERAAVIVAIDHEGYQQHAAPEVRAVADVAEELLVRQGVRPEDMAIVAPFRVQNREIQRELRRRLPEGATLPVIDTVERIQGQEREVVLVSLTCSDPDALRRRTDFFFSPNRLCVTLTRARTKLVVFGSRCLLRTLPRDHEGLLRVDLFHRLFAELPVVDWTARYVIEAGEGAPRE